MAERVLRPGEDAAPEGLVQLLGQAHRLQDKDADGLISLMTPVIKGFLTDRGCLLVAAADSRGGIVDRDGLVRFVGKAAAARRRP